MMSRRFDAGSVWVLGAVLLTAVGCGGSSGSDDFAAIEEVTLVAEPDVLTFNSTGINETIELSFVLENKSSVPATLFLDLQETPTPEDQIREFAWAGNQAERFRNEVTLEGFQSLPVIIAYTPQDQNRDVGKVLITYNNEQTVEVTLESSEIAPDIDGPERVIFGRVPAGGFAQKIISVQNVGRAQLDVGEIFLSETTSEFAFCFPSGAGENSQCTSPETPGAYPPTLDFLDTINIQINYAPTDDFEDVGQLKIQSNDPDERPFTINLSANGAEPCILVEDETGVDFGAAFIGNASQRTVTIQNCSPNKQLIIDAIRLTPSSDEEFFINEAGLPGTLPDSPAIVEVDEAINFVLNYAPLSEDPNQATIEILSNDTVKTPLLIPVTGRGSNNACPEAVATAREVGTAQPPLEFVETIPLATIEFDGSASSDPDESDTENNGVATYEWSIVQRPPDSTSRLETDPNDPARPRLFLDLAGLYEVELRVFDGQNTPSCNTAKVSVLATPDEDVHVQLVWDTPGDPDQTDSGTGMGADLDLHMLHPAGNWNEPPWDCFWRSIEPDWGTDGDTSDNPSLDIDDTDGAGPENINLNNPENITYRVGAYYFSDHAYGPSYATIRIFLSTVLVFEYRDKYLERTGEFWDVSTIEWGTSPRVNQIDQTYDGFP